MKCGEDGPSCERRLVHFENVDNHGLGKHKRTSDYGDERLECDFSFDNAMNGQGIPFLIVLCKERSLYLETKFSNSFRYCCCRHACY